ncbi:hypothetical protein LZ906_017580 (plasmid) [Paraclostridium ghonii]|uniref:hypothetical protein n=1 Tax=Paraclostridium ghonii TaxID=29358 RepID=UPI00202CAF36|nr:hypothetical protein [Paeniclostridium ghonii]MCM0166530.1 hypothetical protein [Paeniclostridium ghonii]
MSSAKYIANQIIVGEKNGGLPYYVVEPPSYWSKYQEEVNKFLKEEGYEHLIVDKIEGLK